MGKIKLIEKLSFMKCKLALRFAIYIFVLTMITTVVFAVIELMREYSIEKDALQQELTQVNITNIRNIEENLWILNIHALRTIFDGLLQKRDFVYFKVTDEQGKTLVEVGKKPKKDFLVQKTPLFYKDAYGKRVYLGELTIVVTTKYIRQDVFKNTTCFCL